MTRDAYIDAVHAARNMRGDTIDVSILRATARHETDEQLEAWRDYVENVVADARKRGEL